MPQAHVDVVFTFKMMLTMLLALPVVAGATNVVMGSDTVVIIMYTLGATGLLINAN